MQAKVLLVDRAHGGQWQHMCRDGLQAQHFLVRPGPTCLRELDALYGLDIAGQLMDAIEQRLR
jgi:hypothetical protein